MTHLLIHGLSHGWKASGLLCAALFGLALPLLMIVAHSKHVSPWITFSWPVVSAGLAIGILWKPIFRLPVRATALSATLPTLLYSTYSILAAPGFRMALTERNLVYVLNLALAWPLSILLGELARNRIRALVGERKPM